MFFFYCCLVCIWNQFGLAHSSSWSPPAGHNCSPLLLTAYNICSFQRARSIVLYPCKWAFSCVWYPKICQYWVPDQDEKINFSHFLLPTDHPLKDFTWVCTACEQIYCIQGGIRRNITESRSYISELERMTKPAECKKQFFSRISHLLLLVLFILVKGNFQEQYTSLKKDTTVTELRPAMNFVQRLLGRVWQKKRNDIP